MLLILEDPCGAYNRISVGEVGDPDSWPISRPEVELWRPAFLDPGYCMSTIGLDEQVIRQYIRNQEARERRLEQMKIQGP